MAQPKTASSSPSRRPLHTAFLPDNPSPLLVSALLATMERSPSSPFRVQRSSPTSLEPPASPPPAVALLLPPPQLFKLPPRTASSRANLSPPPASAFPATT